jgi:hypothetical protein
MSMIEGVPSRIYDPVQSVLALLPDGMYGTYEGLMNHMLLDPTIPMEIKEGLRYLSAVTIGCEFCRTYREVDPSGSRLLPEEFYARVAEGETEWETIAPAPWAPVFQMAVEVLGDTGEIAPRTLERVKASFTDTQIVEALFYMLLVGASHRLSHALGIPAVCSVPATPGTSPSDAQAGVNV